MRIALFILVFSFSAHAETWFRPIYIAPYAPMPIYQPAPLPAYVPPTQIYVQPNPIQTTPAPITFTNMATGATSQYNQVAPGLGYLHSSDGSTIQVRQMPNYPGISSRPLY